MDSVVIGMHNFILETMDGSGMGPNSLLVAINTRNRSSGKANTGRCRSLIWAENEMDYAPERSRFRRNGSAECFSVQKHHLDTNHHVDNCQYSDGGGSSA